MSEDEIKLRQQDLYAELRTLMCKVHRVNLELGNLQMGVEPPDRGDESFIPEFIRRPDAMVSARRPDEVPEFLKAEAV